MRLWKADWKLCGSAWRLLIHWLFSPSSVKCLWWRYSIPRTTKFFREETANLSPGVGDGRSLATSPPCIGVGRRTEEWILDNFVLSIEIQFGLCLLITFFFILHLQVLANETVALHALSGFVTMASSALINPYWFCFLEINWNSFFDAVFLPTLFLYLSV